MDKSKILKPSEIQFCRIKREKYFFFENTSVSFLSVEKRFLSLDAHKCFIFAV